MDIDIHPDEVETYRQLLAARDGEAIARKVEQMGPTKGSRGLATLKAALGV